MNRFLVAFIGVVVAVAAGCSNDKGDSHKSSTKDASADACLMCPGVQKANADGTCPACQMHVAEPRSSAAPSHHPEADKPAAAAAAAAKEDECTHCGGVQTANSEGKCPDCGMDLAKK